MRQFTGKLLKTALVAVTIVSITFSSGVTAKADTTTDAAALYEQQMALLQQYQSILAAQYQAALYAQYQAALTAQANMQQIQANAVDQAYLLNAIQAMQNAQYQAMIQKQGLEYQDYLMKEFNESQKQAMQAFLGYNGL